VYKLNILVVGADGDREDRPLVSVWFGVLDAGSGNLCVDINDDVDAVVFLALAICADGTAVPTKIIDKATNIALFLAKNTLLKSITIELINTCYDYLIINMMVSLTYGICHLIYIDRSLMKFPKLVPRVFPF
jgi:hypothetical protein